MLNERSISLYPVVAIDLQDHAPLCPAVFPGEWRVYYKDASTPANWDRLGVLPITVGHITCIVVSVICGCSWVPLSHSRLL